MEKNEEINIENLVSVVVPIYKVEKYLDKCINSLLNQTYKNIEIILVDDGSPDNCPRICDYYKRQDKRIKVIHKKNGGLSDARNVGIENSLGDYIAFLDSDDWVNKNYIKKLVKLLEEFQVDIAICNFKKVYENKIIEEKIENKIIEEKIEVYTNKEALEELFKEKYVKFIVSWGKIYKKNLFNNIRFPKGKYHEDEFTTYKLLDKSKKVVYTNEQLIYYLQREDSIMATSFMLEKKIDVIQAYKEQIIYFDQNNYKNLKKLSQLKLFNIYFNLKRRRNKLLNKDYKKIFKKLMNENIGNKRKVKIQLMYYMPFIIPLALKTNNFRKYIKNISKKKYEYKKINQMVKKNKKIILIGSPEHGNLGDHLIAKGEMKYLKDNFSKYKIFDITGKMYRKNYKKIKEKISNNDLIFITGGGFLGSLWMVEEEMVRNIISNFSENKIIIFPSTIFFENSSFGKYEYEKSKRIYNSHKDLIIALREKKSLNILKKMINKNRQDNLLLVPDMALYLNESKMEKRESILICFRKDKEKIIDNDYLNNLKTKLFRISKSVVEIDTVINKNILIENREKELKKIISKFRESKLVVTDRLHGMILATITGTSCICVNNLSGKVKGVYEWINKLGYIEYMDNLEEIESYADKLYNCRQNFVYSSKNLDKNFLQLTKKIKENNE